MTRTALLLLALLAACGGDEATTPATAPAAPAAEAPAAAPVPAAPAPAADFQPAPEGASVSFVAPADGATVASPVHVVFGVEGMTVAKAGTMEPGTGHHHLIIDGEAEPIGTVVPADDTHIHYGGGQTETDIELGPGKHTLRLQFADGSHRSYGPQLSTAITVEVSGEATPAAPE